MGRYRVVVSDQVFPSVEVERAMLAEIDADLDVSDGTVDGLIARAADADAVLTTYLPLDASTIEQLPKLRVIARYGIGVDNVDVANAISRGITVTNVPDYSVQEVAAHALALILGLIRKVPQSGAKVRAGGWGLDGLRPIRRVSGLTFGLVGYGKIARRLQRSIEALDAPVIAYDPYVTAAPGLPPLLPLDELLERSDVVSVHAPLTPETRGLIDAAALARMPEGSILVNTSRGPLVVLEAVLDALRSGHLAGAGLDVFDREPLDPVRIEGVPNLIVTPHTGYYSEESIAESQRKAATQVVKALTGQPVDYPVRP
jgi:D-3-phosphoglycerate dehydrogenase